MLNKNRIRFELKTSRKPRNDTGVVLIIILAMTIVTLGAFAYFVYYIPLAKYTATQLRLKTEALCYRIASQTVLGEEARDQFFGALATIDSELKYGTIERAILYYNERSEDAAYSHLDYTTAAGGSLTGGGPAVFKYHPGPGPCSKDETCFISQQLGFPDLSYNLDPTPIGEPTVAPIPDTLVLRSYNSGNFIGCDITASVGYDALAQFLMFLTDPYVVARVIYRQVPIVLDEDRFIPSVTDGSTNYNNTAPNLNIFVDPFLETNLQEIRFEPHSTIPDVTTGGNIFDPASTSAVAGGVEVFSANYPNTNGFQDASDAADLIDFDFDGNNLADDDISLSDIPMPVHPGTVGDASFATSDRQRRIRQCFNAPSLVQGAFLYHFLRFVIRDGFFLGNTSLYMLNAKHRSYLGGDATAATYDANVTFDNAHEYHPGIPNPPTEIIRGDLLDATGAGAEIPFLNGFGVMQPESDTGNAQDYDQADSYITPRAYLDFDLDPTTSLASYHEVDPTGSPLETTVGSPPAWHSDYRLSQGFLQPFVRTSAVTELPFDGTEMNSVGFDRTAAQIQHHGLIAGQLRHCFGLLNGNFGGGDGTTISTGRFGAYNELDLQDDIFGIKADPNISNAAADHSANWDRYYTGTVVPGTPTNPTTRLNALEWVQALGTASVCPNLVPGTGDGAFCYKPNTTTLSNDYPGADSPIRIGGFQPDTLAGLLHLSREPVQNRYTVQSLRINPLPDESAGDAPPAILSPGLFYQSSPFCVKNEASGNTCNSWGVNLASSLGQFRSLVASTPGTHYTTRPAVMNCNDYQYHPVNNAGGCTNSFSNAVLTFTEDQMADPVAGDQLNLFVLFTPPLEKEIPLWNRLLTGNWVDATTSGGTDYMYPANFSGEGTAIPVLRSMYNERIGIVYIDAHSNNHLEADAAYSLLQRALMGNAAGAEALGASSTDDDEDLSNSNWFHARRFVWFLSPFGVRRFFPTQTEYNDSCSSDTPVETCEYGNNGSFSADQAYQSYYSHLLGGDNTGGDEASDNFDGDIMERARSVFDWMKATQRLY